MNLPDFNSHHTVETFTLFYPDRHVFQSVRGRGCGNGTCTTCAIGLSQAESRPTIYGLPRYNSCTANSARRTPMPNLVISFVPANKPS